jgi:hypothetical protein
MSSLPALATDLGFSNNPAHDNTPAWNALMAGGPSWVIYPGSYTFKTKPNACARNMRHEGVVVNNTAFVRDYAASGVDPFIDLQATCSFERFGVFAKQGTEGVGIQLTGIAASDSIVRDCYITTGATGAMWGIPLCLTSGGSLGIRGCYLENLELFAAKFHLLWAVNVRGLSLVDVNCYPAGGTVNHATIQHTGSYRSSDVHWITRYLEALYCYNSDEIKVRSNSPATIIQSGCSDVGQA